MRPPAPGFDAATLDVLTAHPAASNAELADRIRRIDPLVDTASVARTVRRVRRRAEGLGAIEALLVDPAIVEVMINGPGPVWIDRADRLEETSVILDEADIALIIERVLDPLGLRVDRSSPSVDARLADGSRVHVIVPPLAIDGPSVTIRRFGHRTIPIERFGPPEVVAVLATLMRSKVNLLVIGPTAAGKTSLLNALGAMVAPTERVITIEDTAELRLPGRHVVRLEARPANSEGVGEVSLRMLVRNALRMRPDRIVIGEVRGPEALDLVLALNTGHRGSLATCHAGDPLGALRRLETLVLLGDADLPVAAIRSQLATAIGAIVQVERIEGARRIVSVVEVVGDEPELVPIWSSPTWRGEAR